MADGGRGAVYRWRAVFGFLLWEGAGVCADYRRQLCCLWRGEKAGESEQYGVYVYGNGIGFSAVFVGNGCDGESGQRLYRPAFRLAIRIDSTGWRCDIGAAFGVCKRHTAHIAGFVGYFDVRKPYAAVIYRRVPVS